VVDGGPPFEFALDLPREPAVLAARVDVELVIGRGVVAAIGKLNIPLGRISGASLVRMNCHCIMMRCNLWMRREIATNYGVSPWQTPGGSKSKSKGTKKGGSAIRAKKARTTIRRKTSHYKRVFDSDPGCDIETDELLASGKISSAPTSMALLAGAGRAEAADVQPKQVPANDPVPFAQSTTRPQARHWPVKTNHPSRTVVSYETVGGQIYGRPGRRFLAQRNAGARFHVGIDLFAEPGDEVVACENGRVVAFYEFLESSAGEMTFALLVEHASFVVNYGEVTGDSRTRFHWRVGDTVEAGQPIAHVSSTSMTHFEAYRIGTRRNKRWLPRQSRPPALLNPTAYLLSLTSN
jgi:murein DD-endopeptidase MepM/ murein hydrolase activator NlpD